MKAIRYSQYGDESVLRHEEADRPEPGPGEVLVEVAAAAFNPVDVALRAGYLRDVVPLTFPHVPCFDVAGTVVAVGDGVAGRRPGEAVVGFLPMDRPGAAAQFVAAPADVLTGAPTTVPLTDAAALPSSGLTAWQALHEHAALQPGQRLLVVGAGGSVGGYAVQLAVAAGASVVAVAGAQDADRLLGHGAERVVDRTRAGSPEAVGGPVDAVLNLAPVLPQDAAALVAGTRPGGAYVSTVPGPPVQPAGGVRVVGMFVRSDREQLAGLVALVDAGRLQVRVTETLPVVDLPAVHARSAAGALHGKVVLVP